MGESEPWRWALPEKLQVPPDELQARIDIYRESIVLRLVDEDVITTRPVSALDVARAFTRDIPISSGILPDEALWWSSGGEGQKVALAYKGLWQVEQAFRELKSGLEVRPVFLRLEDHVRGHIMVCFLALVLEGALWRMLKEQEAEGSYRAFQLQANGKSWLVRTELPARAFQAFKAVGLCPPLHVQPLS